jgi:hypothetical protein
MAPAVSLESFDVSVVDIVHITDLVNAGEFGIVKYAKQQENTNIMMRNSWAFTFSRPVVQT